MIEFSFTLSSLLLRSPSLLLLALVVLSSNPTTVGSNSTTVGDEIKSDGDALTSLRQLVGSLNYLFENGGVGNIPISASTSGDSSDDQILSLGNVIDGGGGELSFGEACEQGNIICALKKMCMVADFNCDPLLGLMKPSRETLGVTASGGECKCPANQLDLTVVFLSVIIVLKCVIVGLGSFVFRRYCNDRRNDRRDAREKQRASYESLNKVVTSEPSATIYKPTTIELTNVPKMVTTSPQPTRPNSLNAP